MMQKALFFAPVLFDCSFSHTELLIRTLTGQSSTNETNRQGSEYSAVDWPLFLFNVHERIDWLNYDCLPKAALTCSGQFSISGKR